VFATETSKHTYTQPYKHIQEHMHAHIQAHIQGHIQAHIHTAIPKNWEGKTGFSHPKMSGTASL